MKKRAVFLDRDGTVNIEKDHLYRIADWEWMSGAIEAIKGFNEMGLLVIVITNQSGIARGLYTKEDVIMLHCYVDTLLAAAGARIDAYYFCPHHPDYGEIRKCLCRKPQPGLLLKAQQDFDIDMENSFMIGDKYSDALAGLSAGVMPIMLTACPDSGKPDKSGNEEFITVKNLYKAYKYIRNAIRCEI